MNQKQTITKGQSASLSKTFNEADVQAFANTSGDKNPLHIDAQYAASSVFGKQIAHGALVAQLIPAVLGVKLPGPGTICLKQEVSYKEPVYLGDTITAKVKVIKIRKDKPIVTLMTNCYNQHGTLVIEGNAVVMLGKNAATAYSNNK